MKKSELEKWVNSPINENFEYFEDKKNHWQTPEETMSRGGGDCEDLALLKMHTAALLGHSTQKMDMWLNYVLNGDEGHVVLCCRGTKGLFKKSVVWVLEDTIKERYEDDYIWTSQRWSYKEALKRCQH